MDIGRIQRQEKAKQMNVERINLLETERNKLRDALHKLENQVYVEEFNRLKKEALSVTKEYFSRHKLEIFLETENSIEARYRNHIFSLEWDDKDFTLKYNDKKTSGTIIETSITSSTLISSEHDEDKLKIDMLNQEIEDLKRRINSFESKKFKYAYCMDVHDWYFTFDKIIKKFFS